jgi:hypothetical protein
MNLVLWMQESEFCVTELIILKILWYTIPPLRPPPTGNHSAGGGETVMEREVILTLIECKYWIIMDVWRCWKEKGWSGRRLYKSDSRMIFGGRREKEVRQANGAKIS